jgi:hypothetical protein
MIIDTRWKIVLSRPREGEVMLEVGVVGTCVLEGIQGIGLWCVWDGMIYKYGCAHMLEYYCC